MVHRLHGNTAGSKDQEGTHGATCIAGSEGFCESQWMKRSYDVNCSGCQHERRNTEWACKNSGGNGIAEVLNVIGGAPFAKTKSTKDEKRQNIWAAFS